MKCIHCGSDTRVLDTRTKASFMTKRRHQCFDDPKHIFFTTEVPQMPMIQYELRTPSLKIMNEYHARLKRNRYIRINPDKMSNCALARKLRITEARVRQIKQEGVKS